MAAASITEKIEVKALRARGSNLFQMSHLNRIILKTNQVRNIRPALPHCIFRRYGAQKKLFGLKLTLPSPFGQDLDGGNSNFPLPDDKESKNKFGRRDEFYPKVDLNLLKNVKSIAGISVTTYSIGWSRINLREKRLTDYGSVVLSLNKYKQPHQPSTIFKVAKAARMILPQADLYILENFKGSRGRNISFDALEIQLLSMLTALLNTSKNDGGNEDRVFFQNRSVINYLYELSIKSERISAGQKLQRMLNDIVSLENNELSDDIVADLGSVKLNLKSEFVNAIFSSQPLQRDSTAVAFFLVLSFIEMNKGKIDF